MMASDFVLPSNTGQLFQSSNSTPNRPVSPFSSDDLLIDPDENRYKTSNDKICDRSDEDEVITYLFPECAALKTICSSNCNHTARPLAIKGYEIYIVEQWACSRKLSTVITAFTGDSEHQIQVVQVQLPNDRDKWSEQFKHLFKEFEDYGAKPKETDEGILFVTNLSSFPSNLNLLLVPNGNAVEVWDYFKVSVNLRRLNCAGRSALILSVPSDASEDKFRQIYKTHPKIDIMYAVKELVTLVQISLVNFKLLDPFFVDGLLCDKTEKNIQIWWGLFGSVYYGTEPKDGILGPSTLSAILGFVLSCNFRLDMAGSDFPKECFNYFNFRINVGKFQKQYNLQRTWYLDPITVNKLFKVTSKTSTSDISKLKKVVKSRVQDISRRSNSEHNSIEVLTTDLEKCIKYFKVSARLEYLWYARGDVRDLKQFDYHHEKSFSYNTPNSTIRSGVGKIKIFPKKIQDEYIYSSPKRKNRKDDTNEEEYRQKQEQTPQQPLQKSNISTDESPHVNIASDISDVNSFCQAIRRSTDADDFVKNLKRRNSFPYLQQEINIHQMDYRNHNISLNSTPAILKLRRSQSFSLVEESILRWKTVTIPLKLVDLMKAIELSIEHYKSSSHKFKNSKMQNVKNLETCQSKLYRLNLKLKPVLNNCQLQFQANDRINSKIHDVEQLGARLEYETRLLSTRVRDTQDSVNNFMKKLEILENFIEKSMICNRKSWYDTFGYENVLEVWQRIESRFPKFSAMINKCFKSIYDNTEPQQTEVELSSDDNDEPTIRSKNDEFVIQNINEIDAHK
ncbi:hypothetical protein WICMUC_005495 [Wickerhamomyces mucosus]|uniref:STB6-like N-terminal domain-containing protein n=1 Tax=Wickerhamomyces mucosus TaxID=1378264 RepID=A0A9P8T565_9ASCO|nr:hypothetical protein WICMUC_005495 [Wickerhamomyces mucosus]